MTSHENFYQRYLELEDYVGWTVRDERIADVAPSVFPLSTAIVEDFYAEIDKHPNARKVITEEILKLKPD